jgi:protein SMG6
MVHRCRLGPDARAPELHVTPHGMLFTGIQLDDFAPTLSPPVERLDADGEGDRKRNVMAVVGVSVAGYR